ncbi:MAG: DNA internalization-related competence protein ComEC/Rec2 [Eubacteriales bacterium]|nr:DNA internalization-related competence protein ComEC/Rec2 [Eubacteriales bacterium]
MRRKLFFLGIVFSFGSAASACTDAAVRKSLSMLLPLILGIILLFFSESSYGFQVDLSMKMKLGIAAAFLIGCGCYFVQSQFFSSDAKCFDEKRPYIGQVLSVRKKEQTADLEVRILSPSHRRIYPQKVLLTVQHSGENPYSAAGEIIKFSASLELPEPRRNPGGFDDKSYLRGRGIGHRAYVSSFQILPVNAGIYGKILNTGIRLREEFLARVSSDTEVRAFLRGVLFGDSAGLSNEDQEAFQKNGTAHILAVSGLHIGVLWSIFKKMRKRFARRLVTFLFLGIMFFYGTMTCWSISVLRAELFIGILLLGDFLNRRYDLLSALGFSLILLLAWNPGRILSSSFQLSFLAILVISFFAPVMETLLPSGMAGAAAIQIGMLPYMIFRFRRAALLGWLCNPPTIYLCSLLIPIGTICFFMGFLPVLVPAGFSALSSCLVGLARMILSINRLFSLKAPSSLNAVPIRSWQVLLLYLLAFFFCSEYFKILRNRKRIQSVLFLVLLIFSIGFSGMILSYDPILHSNLVMIDVGQGDAMFFHSADGKTILIDGGGSRTRNIGKSTLAPFLLELGARKLDAAFVTHLHMDHYKGIQELNELGMIRNLEMHGTRGMEAKISDDLKIKILWPLKEPEHTIDKNSAYTETESESQDENLYSRVYRVEIHGIRVLVTGDITEEGEKMLLSLYEGTDELSCDILKVAHHGSYTSTSEAFLDAVSPEIAWIGVGKHNRYGHPSKEVITRLRNHGIIVFRTDQNGAIGAVIGKHGRVRICTELKSPDR